jgi:hypothetical protein
VEALVVVWLLCAVVGLVVGQSKGRAGEGFVLGLLLGLIGILIIAVLPSKLTGGVSGNSSGGRPSAAGWFQSPSNPSMIQFFDGARWTPNMAPAPASNVATPGWYPSSVRLGRLQYHDGMTWTDHYGGPESAGVQSVERQPPLEPRAATPDAAGRVAGWYPDPYKDVEVFPATPALRWWDGQRWTERVSTQPTTV